MQKRWKVVAMVTLGLLVITNAWWAYALLDQAVTQKYQDQLLYERTEALKQLSSVALDVTLGNTEPEVRSILLRNLPSADRFEKEGALWAGFLGLRFDQSGRLSEILIDPPLTP